MKKFKYLTILTVITAILFAGCNMGNNSTGSTNAGNTGKSGSDLEFFNPTSEQIIKDNSNYGYVIVKLDSSVDSISLEKTGARKVATTTIGSSEYLYLYKDGEILELLEALNNTPGVVFAEADMNNTRDEAVEYNGDLNDPRLDSSQYSYHITGLGEALKKYGVGENEIYVATIDSGINKLHEEFQGLFAEGDHPGYSMFDKSGTEGAVSYTFRENIAPVEMDYSNWDSNPGEGHGTHVSGTILAKGNNGIGVAGICPDNAKYMFYKCFADDASGNSVGGSGSTWAVYGSYKHLIEWKVANLPADHTVPVNMSLGGDWASNFAIDVINYGLTKKVVAISSSGNDGYRISTFPSSYQGVISVGATNGRDEKVHFSNSGASLSVTAPGFNIISTGNVNGTEEEKYTYKSGTSMAAPFVTGLVGLMLTHDPTLSPAEIKYLLETNADDKGAPGFDEHFGWGRVNVERTIEAVLANDRNTPYSDHLLRAIVYNGEDGAAAVPVYLYNSDGSFVSAALTAEDGSASFGLLKDGDYTIKVFYHGQNLVDGSEAIKDVSFVNVSDNVEVVFNYDFPFYNIITASNDGNAAQDRNTDTAITLYLVEGESFTQLTTYDSGALDKFTYPLQRGKEYVIGISAYVSGGEALDGHYAIRISEDDPAADTYTGAAELVDNNDTLGEPENDEQATAYELSLGTTYNAYLNDTENDYYRVVIPVE